MYLISFYDEGQWSQQLLQPCSGLLLVWHAHDWFKQASNQANHLAAIDQLNILGPTCFIKLWGVHTINIIPLDKTRLEHASCQSQASSLLSSGQLQHGVMVNPEPSGQGSCRCKLAFHFASTKVPLGPCHCLLDGHASC